MMEKLDRAGESGDRDREISERLLTHKSVVDVPDLVLLMTIGS